MADTILVVEDEIPLMEAITLKLKKTGYDVLGARTVAEARKRLDEAGSVKFIWLDHYLQGKESGLDFANELKSKVKYKDIPIFVVSVTATIDKIHAYLKLGITKFYTKADYRLDAIIADIERILSGKDNSDKGHKGHE